MVRLLLAALVACGALLALVAPAFADGHLDRSFGDEGVVDLRPSKADGTEAYARRIAVASQGAIFLAEEVPVCSRGGCPYRIYLKRYHSDGSRDHRFGRVEVGLTDNTYDLTTDPAGRPLVALQDEGDVVIKRFKANGRLDRSFGRVGATSVPCGCFLGSLKVGTDRRPLMVGSADFRKISPYRGAIWVMARLRRDGSPDTGFGGDGIVRHPMPGFYGPAVEVEPSGGALLWGRVCCRFPSKPFIQRMSPSGRLQRGYAAATTRALHGLYGTREDDIGWESEAAVLRPDGRVEIFGGGYRRSVAVELLRNGRRDHSFGRHGVRMLDFEVSDAVADENGGTLLTAYLRGRRPGYRVLRLRADGGFDHGFGRVPLPRASNEEGIRIFRQGRGAAIVFDEGLGFCRQGCEAQPKMYRVLTSGR